MNFPNGKRQVLNLRLALENSKLKQSRRKSNFVQVVPFFNGVFNSNFAILKTFSITESNWKWRFKMTQARGIAHHSLCTCSKGAAFILTDTLSVSFLHNCALTLSLSRARSPWDRERRRWHFRLDYSAGGRGFLYRTWETQPTKPTTNAWSPKPILLKTHLPFYSLVSPLWETTISLSGKNKAFQLTGVWWQGCTDGAKNQYS